MASQRSSRRKDTDGVLIDPGTIQGLDIAVDGGCCPEFDSGMLRDSVYEVRQLPFYYNIWPGNLLLWGNKRTAKLIKT